jgi:hypothetical protein
VLGSSDGPSTDRKPKSLRFLVDGRPMLETLFKAERMNITAAWARIEGRSMNRWPWVLGVSAALLGTACGGGNSSGTAGGISAADSASFVGIYQATDYTDKAGEASSIALCNTPSTASQLSSLDYMYFLVASVDMPDEQVVRVVSCTTVSECQTTRVALTSGGSYASSFRYTLTTAENATTLSGFEPLTSDGDGVICTDLSYADHTLTLNPDHSVKLESRTKQLTEMPQRGNNCDVTAAEAKAADANAPCSGLEVLAGTFVQAM